MDHLVYTAENKYELKNWNTAKEDQKDFTFAKLMLVKLRASLSDLVHMKGWAWGSYMEETAANRCPMWTRPKTHTDLATSFTLETIFCRFSCRLARDILAASWERHRLKIYIFCVFNSPS